MRTRSLTLLLAGAGLLTGCATNHKPFATDTMLYYKPTLSNSETVIAENAAHRGPVQPPAPALAADPPKNALPLLGPKPIANAAIVPVNAESPSPVVPTEIQPINRQSSGLVPPVAPINIQPIAPQSSGLVPPVAPAASLPLASSIPERPQLYSEMKPVPVSNPAPPPTIVPLSEPIVPKPIEPIAAKTLESVAPTIEKMQPFAIVPDKPKMVELLPDQPPIVAAGPMEKRKAPGRYYHDAAYRWLQGVVEKDARGHSYIRFCDPSIDDEYGGKFAIEDARLNQFHDGDVIGLEGERAMDSIGKDRNVRFTIREVWSVTEKR